MASAAETTKPNEHVISISDFKQRNNTRKLVVGITEWTTANTETVINAQMKYYVFL